MLTEHSKRNKEQCRQNANLAKLQKKIRRFTCKAIEKYNMIVDGDKVMCCLSGGKDSYTMLDILLSLQSYSPAKFEIIAVNLDQKQPGFPEHVLPEYLSSLEVPYKIIQEDTYSIVKEKIPEGKTTCSLCSRLRRSILYTAATELGATKVALGHHREDIIETLFLNMFHGGKLKAMPPKLRSDDGKHTVIRPLAFCREHDIARYSYIKKFPIIPCNLCGSQPNLQRNFMKNMLKDWETSHPGRVESIFKAITDVVPSHLGDTKLYDFDFSNQDQQKNSTEDLIQNTDTKTLAQPAFSLEKEYSDRISIISLDSTR